METKLDEEQNKKEEPVTEDVEVVPLNVIIGELEIIKQKLYAHVMVLSVPEQKKEGEDKDGVQQDKESR